MKCLQKMIGFAILLIIMGCTGPNKGNNSEKEPIPLNDETTDESANQPVDENTLILGLKNSKLYKETVFDDFDHDEFYIPKNIKAKLKPEFIIGFESQLAIVVRQRIIGSKQYSTPMCNFDSYMIEGVEPDDVIKQCFLQIGEFDFDNDDISEVVIAYGRKGYYIKCYVFKYHEPANIADGSRDENWSRVGEFENGNTQGGGASVEKNKIYFPYGYRISMGYVYVDNMFVEIK